MGVVVLLFWLSACATLQQQKEYKNYTKNTDWKVRKL